MKRTKKNGSNGGGKAEAAKAQPTARTEPKKVAYNGKQAKLGAKAEKAEK